MFGNHLTISLSNLITSTLSACRFSARCVLTEQNVCLASFLTPRSGSVYGRSDRSRRRHRAVREQRPPWFRPTRSPSRTTRWLRVSRTRSKAAGSERKARSATGVRSPRRFCAKSHIRWPSETLFQTKERTWERERGETARLYQLALDGSSFWTATIITTMLLMCARNV